jgi:hypothetical protein
MAHTPGPWYSAYSKTDEFGGGNIRSNHHVDGTGALLFDAGPMFHDYEVNREEELANLHLAAAAPDLLEALVDLVEIVDDDHYKCDLDSDEYCDITDEGGWHVKHHNLRLAKQAIAKAKGVTV